MKNNLINLYLIAFFLLSDFMVFAQPGSEEDGGGGLEDADPVPHGAPINSKLILLALIGAAFVLYTYRKNKKIA